jgi:hypothetical protein
MKMNMRNAITGVALLASVVSASASTSGIHSGMPSLKPEVTISMVEMTHKKTDMFPATELFFRHGTYGNCPYPSTAGVDGCANAAAPSALSVKLSGFYSGYAQQTGQSWPATAGNTGTGNPGVSSPHPPHNVAGVDYAVGIRPAAFVTPGTDSYGRNNDPTTPGYGLKLLTNANLTLDQMYGTVNGCAVSGSRLLCQGTMPNNSTLCPATAEGDNCLLLAGYDWTSPTSGGGNGSIFFSFSSGFNVSKITVQDCYIAPGPNTYGQYSLQSIAVPALVTYQYNYFNSFFDLASIETGSPGISWPGNFPDADLIVSITATNLSYTDNPDCGSGLSIAICIQYNAIVNSASRAFAIDPIACTTSCDGQQRQFNYLSMGNNLTSQITAFVDDGLGSGGAYDGNAGNCLTVTATNNGYPVVGGASGITAGFAVVSNASAFNQLANRYYLADYAGYPAGQGCNSTYPNSSFRLVTSPGGTTTFAALGPVPPTSMYVTSGTHGDTFFISFGSAGSVPMHMTSLGHNYNTIFFPKDVYGVTGAETYNTTAGTTLRAATINNCSPTCASSTTAGHTLNVTNYSQGSYPTVAQGAIVVGQTIPGTGMGAVTPFAAAGTLITGSAANSATCDNGPCTGNGGNGTYLVGGSSQLVSFAGSAELSAVQIDTLSIVGNVFIINATPDLSYIYAGASGSGATAAVIGDNHSVSLGTTTITGNFYDPSGSLFCIYPNYSSVTSLTISNNVNMLGSGGAYDPQSNSYGCAGSLF